MENDKLLMRPDDTGPSRIKSTRELDKISIRESDKSSEALNSDEVEIEVDRDGNPIVSDASSYELVPIRERGRYKPRPKRKKARVFRMRNNGGRVLKRGRRLARQKRYYNRAPRFITRESIDSMLSSGTETPVCKLCGHRCCFRRLKSELKKVWIQRAGYQKRVSRKKPKRRKVVRKKKRVYKKNETAIQVGSKPMIQSPLCIKTEVVPAALDQTFTEVTPEMLQISVEQLTMWTAATTTEQIAQYIQRNYPVNGSMEELLVEVNHKLQIALVLGMVTKQGSKWMVGDLDQQRHIDQNQVSIFWKMYCDTLSPLKNKRPEIPQLKPDREDEEICKENPLRII